MGKGRGEEKNERAGSKERAYGGIVYWGTEMGKRSVINRAAGAGGEGYGGGVSLLLCDCVRVRVRVRARVRVLVWVWVWARVGGWLAG